jgi:hypothetical protein
MKQNPNSSNSIPAFAAKKEKNLRFCSKEKKPKLITKTNNPIDHSQKPKDFSILD